MLICMSKAIAVSSSLKPGTMAKNEKSFSKMKIIKIFMGPTMPGERLEDLIVLTAEKDITDTIDLDVVVKAWI